MQKDWWMGMKADRKCSVKVVLGMSHSEVHSEVWEKERGLHTKYCNKPNLALYQIGASNTSARYCLKGAQCSIPQSHGCPSCSLHKVLWCFENLLLMQGIKAMQANTNSQRSTQRRNPTGEVSNPPPGAVTQINSSQAPSGSRSSSGSARSSTYRGKNVCSQSFTMPSTIIKRVFGWRHYIADRFP